MSVETMRLFEPHPKLSDPEPGESYTRRLTRRNRDYLAAGIHPATRKPLSVNEESRCGTCVHLVANPGHARTYYKCALHKRGVTSGPVTDVRVGWPGCSLFFEADPE